jgi:phage I-like protein
MKQRIKLVPKGEFPHPSGLIQVIDDLSITQMAANFNPANKILFDFDHYSDLSNDQRAAALAAGIQLPSEASGWVSNVEAMPDGLYGEVEWTPAGAAAIRNRSYRFQSPVFRRRDIAIIESNRVRPMALSKVALTNEPNIRDFAALCNSADGSEHVSGPIVETLANGMDYKNLLIEMLKLSPEATDIEIQAAIDAAKSNVAEVETMANRLAEISGKLTEAESKIKIQEEAELKVKVSAALETYQGVIQNREQIEAALSSNFDGTVAILAGLKVIPNRADGDLPIDGTAKPKLTGIDRVKHAFKS